MRKTILHPYLFSLYFILFLFSINIDLMPFSATLRVLILQFITVTLLLVIIGLISKSWLRAGLVTTLAVLLFNSYGHIYFYFNENPANNFPLARADILAAIWAATFILVGWFFLRKLSNAQPLNNLLNIIAFTLLLFPLFQIGRYYLFVNHYSSQAASHPFSEQIQLKQSTDRPPDIYYIILDEYGRADVLEEVMHYDNSTLIQHLEEKGFYVADKSHSNYSVTQFSINSSLNLDYLPQELNHRRSSLQSMQRSRVRQAIQGAGYKLITFATGYALSEITDSDYFFKPAHYINSFEFTYISSTALAVISESLYGSQYRNMITNSFNMLKEIQNIEPDVPKFIFAHIQAAHAPFVFGPNGEDDQIWTYPLNPEDAEAANSSYVNAYAGQVAYIDRLIIDAIDSILASSELQPIIIIQGDHGPQSLFNWYSYENICLKERMSILNAYYLPGFDHTKLYPTITPVNTFRLIFDSYFGTSLGFLPDRTYLTIQEDLSSIKDVTSQVESCLLPAP